MVRLNHETGEGGDVPPSSYSCRGRPVLTRVFRNFRALPLAILLMIAAALPVMAGPFEDAVDKFANDEFSDTEEAVGVLATGGTSKMLPNHHITKPVFIGEIKANGQFDVVWKTPGLVAGDAWSKELEGSKDLIGDWVGKKCGNYNTKTNKCGGQGS